MYTSIKNHIVYLKYIQFLFYHSYFNKAANKKKEGQMATFVTLTHRHTQTVKHDDVLMGFLKAE